MFRKTPQIDTETKRLNPDTVRALSLLEACAGNFEEAHSRAFLYGQGNAKYAAVARILEQGCGKRASRGDLGERLALVGEC